MSAPVPLARAACGMLLAAATLVLAPARAAFAGTWTAFSSPQPVTIAGYPGSAEEPFISPDGRYLLFNSSEAEPDFSLQYALVTAPASFQYQGAIQGQGVNEPRSLSGAPTLDDEGNVYWISNRSYGETLSTVYAGHFTEGLVTGVHLVPGVSGEKFGTVDFDVGASPDGRYLYVAKGTFELFSSGPPKSASIVSYERSGEGFVAFAAGKSFLAAVNKTGALVYAPAITADELELFYTAASPTEGREPQIYRARRASTSLAFGHVERIAAITGFAEAPSISSDGTTLYYHEKVGEEVHIQTDTRIADLPTVTGVSPRTGSSAGGTVVSITGTFLSGASAVLVGGAQATEINVISPGSITARTPPGTTGTDDVTVTTGQGSSAANTKDHFTYGPPRVSAVSPASGPAAGGTTVTVDGAGFALGSAATSFVFGAAQALSVECASSQVCTMVAPAGAPGVVDVRATVAAKTSAKVRPADEYVYE